MIAEAVDLFWRLAPDGPSSFPRDLDLVVSLALPLTIIELPCLSCSQIDAFLTSIGGGTAILCSDRRLRGCLVAVRGEGAIFADPADPPDERRFTIAHEIGHFLLDYHLPRLRVLRALGERIRPVLDGDRGSTPKERIEAVLDHVPIGIHLDLMERGAGGEIEEGEILASEARADLFALELLAPADIVAERMKDFGSLSVESYCVHVARLLHDDFGLPRRIATGYARLLQRQFRPVSMRDRLGLV